MTREQAELYWTDYAGLALASAVINGSASVIGSIITVMLAMTRGFTSVFWAAALLYALAAWLYARSFKTA